MFEYLIVIKFNSTGLIRSDPELLFYIRFHLEVEVDLFFLVTFTADLPCLMMSFTFLSNLSLKAII